MWVAWDLVGEFTHNPLFRGWPLVSPATVLTFFGDPLTVGGIVLFAFLIPLAVLAIGRALLWAVAGFWGE